MKLISFKILAVLPAIFLMGCTKDSIDINIKCKTCPSNQTNNNNNNNDNGNDNDNSGDNNGGSGGSGSNTNKNLIQFVPYVISDEIVKSTTIDPLAANRYVDIYVYKDNKQDEGKNYKSQSSGPMYPNPGPAMYLSDGTYTFYAAGTNETTNEIPSFPEGVASGLVNGVDYLGWQSPKTLDITTSTTIDVDLSHCCTQVILKIATENENSSSGSTPIYSVSDIKVTPSVITDKCTWDLFTGVINPAKSLSSTQNSMAMSNDGFFGEYIMVPLDPSDSSSKIIFSFTVQFTEYSSKLRRDAEFSIPDGGLKGGYSYLFTVEFKEELVEIIDVNVIDWVDVSDGIPVIPTQLRISD